MTRDGTGLHGGDGHGSSQVHGVLGQDGRGRPASLRREHPDHAGRPCRRGRASEGQVTGPTAESGLLLRLAADPCTT